MSEQTVERFIDVLGQLESNRNLDAIADVFSEECVVGNVVMGDDFKGRAGARKFWNHYRDTFGDVRSDFHNIIVSGNRAALEWTTVGTSQDGKPFKYHGVSILEIEGDRVVRFQAYFDPRELTHQIVKETNS